MIESFSIETAHMFGDALVSQHKLRYREFIERQGWDIPSINGLEYDQYDTPATVYFVWRDEDNIVRGVARLNPTDRPYMLKDIWPHFVTEIELPDTSKVWEGTRFAIDHNLDSKLRRRILGELVCAYHEYCLKNNIKQVIGLMPVFIFKRVFIRSGWPVQFIGDTHKLGRDRVVAGIGSTSYENLNNIKKTMGISGSILTSANQAQPMKEAA